MPRTPIYDAPMSTAERKARSRANALGHLDAQLDLAERLAADWRRCVEEGRPGATNQDIRDAFAEIGIMIARARLSIPRS